MLTRDDLLYLEEEEDDEITTVKKFMLGRAKKEKEKKEEEEAVFKQNLKRSRFDGSMSVMTSEVESSSGVDKYTHHDYSNHREMDMRVEVGGIEDEILDEYDGIFMSEDERENIIRNEESSGDEEIDGDEKEEQNNQNYRVNLRGFKAFVKNIKNFKSEI